MHRVLVHYALNSTMKIDLHESARISVQIIPGTKTGSVTLYDANNEEVETKLYAEVHSISRKVKDEK